MQQTNEKYKYGWRFFIVRKLYAFSTEKNFYLSALKYFRGVLCCGCLLIFSAMCIANDKKIYQFDIPQQSLAKSLNELSDHTKTLVLFPYDLIDERQGHAVKGHYTLV